MPSQDRAAPPLSGTPLSRLRPVQVELSTVTTEAKLVKACLSDAQAELEAANAEVDQLRGLLQGAEAELWPAVEEEAATTGRENADLAGMCRALGDKNNGLRRALEWAAEDASVEYGESIAQSVGFLRVYKTFSIFTRDTIFKFS